MKTSVGNWQSAFCLVGGMIYGLSGRLWPGRNPFAAEPVIVVTWMLGMIGVVAISMMLGTYVGKRMNK